MVVDMVTTTEEVAMARKLELDEATVERLRALKAKSTSEGVDRDRLREVLREARAARRDAAAEDKPTAKEAVREARAELREARAELREAKDALADFEREHGLREGAIQGMLDAMINGAVAKALEAVREHLVSLEGRVVEALPGLVAGAVASAVKAVDFGLVLPAPVGAAVEAVDDQVLDVLADVVAETFDADGLTLDDVAAMAAKRLNELGVAINTNTILGKVQAFLGK